ncbi:hypothetical protein M0654_20995 [Rhizobium sp. NTR19]|uniref:Uncharacterized protein n=1 Tax=Neorhizobium turbinariae TaxID=2937795 RepID=A0ABT0IX47_9HYPH|nr:hypothetical protein [Neorhizobium turbinariae]MCK8782458.1 hypothetical protein [Neorhizobium turbinariae]
MINEVLRNIVYYLEIALAKPLVAIVPIVLTVLVGGYFVLSMPKVYQSEALMRMQFQQIPINLASPTVANDRLEFVEQRVLSRKNLLDLEERFNLFPQLRGGFTKSQLAGLVRNQIALNIQFAENSDLAGNSGSIRIGYKHTDPVIAARVVSHLVSEILEESRRMRVARASETTRFFEREYQTAVAKYKEREAVWNRYAEENSDAHPARIPALLVELQSKEQEISLIDREIATLNEELRLHEAQLRMGAERNGEGTRLNTQLNQIEVDLAAKTLIYSPSHPQVRALSQRLDDMKALIASRQQTRAEASSPGEHMVLSPELMLIAERIAEAKPRREQSMNYRSGLAQRITELRMVIARSPEVEAQTHAHDAEKASLQRTMDDIKGKLDVALLGERLEVGDAALQIELVEEPEVPRYPAGPRKIHMALAVLSAAAAAGGTAVFAAHLLDRTIRGTFDLSYTLSGHTLVVIPRWSPKRRKRREFRDGLGSAAPP